MNFEEAERMLSEWATVTRDRDARVRSAVAAGLTNQRVHHIPGIGRSTIDRILARTPDAGCASDVPDRGRNDH